MASNGHIPPLEGEPFNEGEIWGGLIDLSPARLAALMAEGMGYFAKLVTIELAIRAELDAWHDAGHPEDEAGEGCPGTTPLYPELNTAIDEAESWFQSMVFLARAIELEPRQ